MRMRHSVICGLTYFFPHCHIKCMIFKKEKKWLKMKCNYRSLSTAFVPKFLFLRIIQRDLIKTCTEVLFTDFRNILKYQTSWKSLQWKASFQCGRANRRTQTDRQTGMTKLVVAFRSFENAPKKAQTVLTTLLLVPVLNQRFKTIPSKHASLRFTLMLSFHLPCCICSLAFLTNILYPQTAL
jgi:hypothetical protein